MVREDHNKRYPLWNRPIFFLLVPLPNLTLIPCSPLPSLPHPSSRSLHSTSFPLPLPPLLPPYTFLNSFLLSLPPSPPLSFPLPPSFTHSISHSLPTIPLPHIPLTPLNLSLPPSFLISPSSSVSHYHTLFLTTPSMHF